MTSSCDGPCDRLSILGRKKQRHQRNQSPNQLNIEIKSISFRTHQQEAINCEANGPRRPWPELKRRTSPFDTFVPWLTRPAWTGRVSGDGNGKEATHTHTPYSSSKRGVLSEEVGVIQGVPLTGW